MRACQVVPDIPSFAVDDGFRYLVPDGMHVAIGSRVRVRVSGRRLKGFVTAVFDAPGDRKLLPIDGVSGSTPSFDALQLRVLRWAARHYVAPMATILKRTIPPNIAQAEYRAPEARTRRDPVFTNVVSDARSHIRHISHIVENALAKRDGTLVVAPSVGEATDIASRLGDDFGDDVSLATSSASAKDATRAWTRAAASSPVILVGTREIMLWPVARIGRAVIVEDGRRVMKSPSSPTLAVREVLIERAKTEGFDITFLSPVPTLESIAAGAAVEDVAGRQWPLVEVMDRSEEPPSRTVLLERTLAAIAATVKRGGRVFVLVPTRGYAPAFRCTSCGVLRRCAQCDTAATRSGDCRRCGASLAACANCGKERFEPLGAGIGSVKDAIVRSLGDFVGVAGENKPVTVGSERDLVGHADVALSVAVDIDGMVHAPTFLASENALRLLVRLANLLQKGRGHRLVVQTAMADQPIVRALRAGRSQEFLAAVADERRAGSFPPFGELIALEIDRKVAVETALVEAVGGLARVMGPAAMRDRDRWLIQAPDLMEARVALRGLVGALRDKGARVRVDVDPIDL